MKRVAGMFLAILLSVGLVACGGGGGGGEDPPITPEPTAQEVCEAAGGRYNADGTCTSAQDLAIEAEEAAISGAIANAKTAADALTAQSSEADVEAAEALVAAAREAITGAMYASASDTAASLAALDAVSMTVATAKAAVAERIKNEMALAERVKMQKDALMAAAEAIDTSDLSDQDKVDAARTAIVGLRGALMAAADVSDADKAMYQSMLDDAVDAVDAAQGGLNTATRRTDQMEALTSASSELQIALNALAGKVPTQAQIDDANAALTALNEAIGDAADLTDEEKAPYQREAANAATPIQTAQTARNNADDDADDTADKAAVAMAMKLYDGISAPTAVNADPEASRRHAAYSGESDSTITVTNGATAQILKADKATVAANRGWQGMKYMASGTGVTGTYEARVYSDVGKATEGAKFSATYPYDTKEVSGANTELSIDTGTAAVQGRIASSSFNQSAGKKEFKLGTNLERVVISGSYHGVSGSYYCDPGDNQTCAATVADKGFTLSGGTWTFKATNKDDRLMDVADTNYASYGWWIHMSADGKTFTASAFMDDKGTAPTELAISALRGTATYTGGAAGKYAISNPTGSPNDSGHFTADVELTATFAEEHKIEGIIDNFTGADGESRDWSIELKEAALADNGSITRTGEGQANNDTMWTIDGTAASSASGEWSGKLQEAGDDDVPKIATGTFYSEFNRSGKMVGAFGATKQ